MRITQSISATCQGILLLVISSTVYSQSADHSGKVLGQIRKYDEGKAYIYHDVVSGRTSFGKLIDENNKDFHNSDALEAISPSKITFYFIDDNNADVTVSSGEVKMVDEGDGETALKIERGVTLIDGHFEHTLVFSDELSVPNTSTVYEIHATPGESRLYVYAGEATVFSRNLKYPDPVVVRAGEWVRANGEAISPPERFIAGEVSSGPGAGTSACIYSDCKITDEYPIPQPPVLIPEALIPPPVNPPSGRQ